MTIAFITAMLAAALIAYCKLIGLPIARSANKRLLLTKEWITLETELRCPVPVPKNPGGPTLATRRMGNGKSGEMVPTRGIEPRTY